MREVAAEPLTHGRRVVARQVDGVGEPAEVEVVVELRRLSVPLARRVVGLGPVVVQGDADGAPLHVLVRVPVQLDRRGVGEEHVVAAPVLGRLAVLPRREAAGAVARAAEHPRLVERQPVRHEVPERPEAKVRVVGELSHNRWVQPVLVVWEVPVVERHERLDAVQPQPRQQAHVEVDAGRVGLVVGQHAGPGDREAEGVEAYSVHPLDVLRPEVVEVVGHVAGVPAVLRGPRVEPVIPDRRLPAALVPRALHLVARRGAPPEHVLVRGKRLHDVVDVGAGAVPPASRLLEREDPAHRGRQGHRAAAPGARGSGVAAAAA
mmetsp:Transcript_48820/g.137990  ORF Transcript_48820/g.137990 Transcript_48820/m.137990 type:complete len:320 (-) Transcript_48820:2-961(-)